MVFKRCKCWLGINTWQACLRFVLHSIITLYPNYLCFSRINVRTFPSLELKPQDRI